MKEEPVIKCLISSNELIHSDQEGLGRSDGSESYRVAIKGENLDASLNVYAFDPMDNSLAKFLNGIAKKWRGWNNEEKWTSLEGEFSLACKHDGLGHVEIEATLCKPGGWIVQNTFHLLAGELDTLAGNVIQFFDLGKNPRIN